MKYKPDWDEARQRLDALWHGSAADRPCIAVVTPANHADAIPPPSQPSDPMAQWMDPDYVVPLALSYVSSHWWGGEAIPSFLLMAGWLISLGGKPDFDRNTIWFDEQTVDFSKPSPFRHSPIDPLVKQYEKLYLALAEAAGWDDFMVGSPCLLPASDLLAMHMGTENFLMALVDYPEWMKNAIESGARDLVAARQQLADLVKPLHFFWYGNAGWMPFWAPQPFAGLQSDVSCMLSLEMFEKFIVPELQIWARHVGPLWYHLDGGDALQHLTSLLSLPSVRVIQYTPRPSEPPNGPAHLELYRTIQKAGRIVHIHVDVANVEPLCRELDPRRLMLYVTSCRDEDEGLELLSAARRWCSATVRRASPGLHKHDNALKQK